jgi:hypothetical protein
MAARTTHVSWGALSFLSPCCVSACLAGASVLLPAAALSRPFAASPVSGCRALCALCLRLLLVFCLPGLSGLWFSGCPSPCCCWWGGCLVPPPGSVGLVVAAVALVCGWCGGSSCLGAAACFRASARPLYFSQHLTAIPLPDKSAATTSRVFRQHMLGVYGAPAEVLTDQGTEVRDEFHALCVASFIDHRTTSAYHPQANGLAERAVESVKRALGKLAHLAP